MNDDFSIRITLEYAAPLAKLRTQALKIIDLTVKNDANRLLLVEHWLMAGERDINDAEPRMSKPDPSLYAYSRVVRTPMPNGRKHRFQTVPGRGADKPRYPAHTLRLMWFMLFLKYIPVDEEAPERNTARDHYLRQKIPEAGLLHKNKHS